MSVKIVWSYHQRDNAGWTSLIEENRQNYDKSDKHDTNHEIPNSHYYSDNNYKLDSYYSNIHTNLDKFYNSDTLYNSNNYTHHYSDGDNLDKYYSDNDKKLLHIIDIETTKQSNKDFSSYFNEKSSYRRNASRKVSNLI